MGKIPQSFRAPITNLLKNPHSIPPRQSPSPTPPQKPDRFVKKKPQLSGGKDLIDRAPFQNSKSAITFSSPNLSDAKKIFTSIITNSHTTHDIRFYNSILQSFSSISSIKDSISLLRYMTKTNPAFTPERSTYHILLTQSCKSPDSTLTPVHETLNQMVADGFPLENCTTDIAIKSLCLAGREEDAVELIKEISRKHSTPDAYTYNFLVKHLCKTRALATAYNFIDDMRNSFDMKPDLVTYTILIDNVCNSKNLREATRLLSVLSEEGFKPDCFLYNTIMKGYCIMNRGSEAIGVFKKMKEEGVEPDIVTYNTLIFGLSKSGRVKEARKYLDVMAEMGHFPDAVTYTSLMNGMCREGNALGALALLEEMEAKGCSPNSCTYNTLLHGLCKSRLLERGMELYGMMVSGGMELESATYATLVRVLCRNDRIAEAYEVFDYAVESKSMKDVAAYDILESTLKSLEKAKERGHAI